MSLYVPGWVKATVPIALLYVVSPIDVLPDVIPGIGQIDDLMIVYGALKLFLRMSPRAAVAFHRDAIAASRSFTKMPASGVVIDAEFRRDV